LCLTSFYALFSSGVNSAIVVSATTEIETITMPKKEATMLTSLP
jgi:hypothetical protein